MSPVIIPPSSIQRWRLCSRSPAPLLHSIRSDLDLRSPPSSVVINLFSPPLGSDLLSRLSILFEIDFMLNRFIPYTRRIHTKSALTLNPNLKSNRSHLIQPPQTPLLNAPLTSTAEALKELPREKIQLATKFGIFKIEPTGIIVKGTPEYARSCCEGSLKRLGVDYIDLYYIHRIDTTVPIEDTISFFSFYMISLYLDFSITFTFIIVSNTSIRYSLEIQMEELKKMVEEGKIKELGIGIVPYSPVGRGFFGGKAVKESLPENTTLGSHPRFTGENFTKNKVVYDRVDALAKRHGCTPVQLALSWVLHQGEDLVPIPGTTKIKNLDENVGTVKVKLTKEDVEEISNAVPIDEVVGCRTSEALLRISWKFANSPPKHNT
ncbi:hypothetical protein LXL04_037098 [Taraxacum kok-saghyz]